jgi:GNAT superfamily N-acetyltransferase
MDYELDDDPARIRRDTVWAWLSTRAYWGRWRDRTDFEAQLDSAWRMVGVYTPDGTQVGFARAVSDGVCFAFLADVYIDDAHRGAGLGKRLVARMIDDGPGADYRWMLVTLDAHTLYGQFGFSLPGPDVMVRPAAVAKR